MPVEKLPLLHLYALRDKIKRNVLRIVLNHTLHESIQMLESILQKTEANDENLDFDFCNEAEQAVVELKGSFRDGEASCDFADNALRRLIACFKELNFVEEVGQPTWGVYAQYQLSEVVGGVGDSLYGTYSMFRHPIEFLQNTKAAISHPIETLTCVGRQAWNRPMRFLSSSATGWLTGKVMSYGVDKVGQYTSSTLRSALEANHSLQKFQRKLASIKEKILLNENALKKHEALKTQFVHDRGIAYYNLDGVTYHRIDYEQVLIKKVDFLHSERYRLVGIRADLLEGIAKTKQLCEQSSSTLQHFNNMKTAVVVSQTANSIVNEPNNYYMRIISEVVDYYTSEYKFANKYPSDANHFTLIRSERTSSVNVGENATAVNVGNQASVF